MKSPETPQLNINPLEEAERANHQKMDADSTEKPEAPLDSTENMLKERIKFLHEKYKPEVFFVTQTSSVLLGWTIKEAYKAAWPDEDVPKFFTIDVRNPMHNHKYINKDENKYLYNSRLDEYRKELAGIEAEILEEKQKSDGGFIVGLEHRKNCLLKDIEMPKYDFTRDKPEKSWTETKDIKNKILKIIKKYKINGNIVVVDEANGFGDFLDPDQNILIENYKNYCNKIISRGPRRGRSNPGPDYFASRSLNIACDIIKDAMVDCGYDSLVLGMGLDDRDRTYQGPWKRTSNNDEGGYRRVQTPEEIEQAKKRIKYSKKTGEKIGKLIKKELEQN